MNKKQKIGIAIALLIMASLLIYVPWEIKNNIDVAIRVKQSLIFLVPMEGRYAYSLAYSRIFAELAFVGFIGGALVILLGLKKRE
jgi:uncharacterized membrane protein YphA (DoxX/SURF4 family)